MEVTSLFGCVILGDLSGILNLVVVGVSPSLFQKSGNNEFTTLFYLWCWGREETSWVKFWLRIEVGGSSVCYLVEGWEYPKSTAIE